MKPSKLFTAAILCSCAFASLAAAPAKLSYDGAKEAALIAVLGPMYDKVGHAIIPFDLGGAVDMYYFPQATGTAMATMELLREDGDLPRKSRIGTYEFVAFTRERVDSMAFAAVERPMCGIFTTLGFYCRDEILNPMETAEVPDGDGTLCLILDEYPTKGKFDFDGRKHGLLLVVRVFRDEMEYAMANGTRKLVEKLKTAGYYPYSDLDRPSVAGK